MINATDSFIDLWLINDKNLQFFHIEIISLCILKQ